MDFQLERRGGGIVEAQPIPDSSPGRDDDVKRRKGGRLFLWSLNNMTLMAMASWTKAQLAGESVSLFVRAKTDRTICHASCYVLMAFWYVSVRNLDISGRGYLTNEKVYGLMTEQLAMQSKIFQFKKIIIG